LPLYVDGLKSREHMILPVGMRMIWSEDVCNAQYKSNIFNKHK